MHGPVVRCALASGAPFILQQSKGLFPLSPDSLGPLRTHPRPTLDPGAHFQAPPRSAATVPARASLMMRNGGGDETRLIDGLLNRSAGAPIVAGPQCF